MLMAPPVMQALIQGRNGCFPNLATGQKTKHKTEQNALSVPVKGMQAPNTHSCLINWVSKVNTGQVGTQDPNPHPQSTFPALAFILPAHLFPHHTHTHSNSPAMEKIHCRLQGAGRRQGEEREWGRKEEGRHTGIPTKHGGQTFMHKRWARRPGGAHSPRNLN